MKKILFLIAVVISITSFTKLVAQPYTSNADTSQYPYWVTMMQDPNANFFQIQSAFNKYWKNREITKGCGWKPFKRWESMMESRVSLDGRMPAPDEVRNAYYEYMSKSDNSNSLAGNWVSQGPNSTPGGYKGLGRLNAIAFHPTNPDIIYVGAPSGGLWITTTGGNQWTTTTDGIPSLGVSAIAIDPLNPSTIYIGTGDRDASDAPGMGVMKSTDNGLTWLLSNTGMGKRIVGDLLIDYVNPLILYAATTSGIYKSIDGGSSWVLKLTGGFKDIAFKPGNRQVIYGTQAGKFYLSTDSGENWVQITNGLADASRGVIATSPANPEAVYFLLSKSDNSFRGLYRSFDAGSTFIEMSNSPNIMNGSCDGAGTGGQSWYNLAIVADPIDANTIYAGGINIWKSTNGGANWQLNAHWTNSYGCGVPEVHADQHIFTINPINKRIYIGNDGGIYWTENGGTKWTDISNGLVISQAYKIGQSADTDDLVLNGYQDNGTSILENGSWRAIGQGDGMECAFDQTNSNYRYTTMQYGPINRVIGSSSARIAGLNANGITEEGAWVTPFFVDKKDPNIMFVGYKNIWRSNNLKTTAASSVTWKKISTINTGNLNVLEQSPINTNIVYASSGGVLYISTNAQTDAPSWQNISTQLISNLTISDIEASPFEENTVYIIQDKNIYKSTDRGTTWKDITGGLPPIHYSSIIHYKNSLEGLYVGSDAGVYYKDNSLNDWIPFSKGLPTAIRASELEIYYDPTSPAGDRIKVGTYGRGTWKSDMYFASPNANFTSDQKIISSGCQVNFKDLSSGIPFQWQWSFAGGRPSTSTEKNPKGITYSKFGTYDVELTVTNTSGTHIIKMPDYIAVSDTIKLISAFEASPVAFCDVNQIVQFTDISRTCPIAWKWTFIPNTVTFANGTNADSQNPQVRFTQPGPYTIKLEANNSNGSSSVTKSNYISAGGATTPFFEDFENNNFDNNGWSIENVDNLISWDIATVSGNSPGNKAAWMNFFNYPVPPGRRDRLILPPLSFIGTNPVFMSFEHAYANRFTSTSDSLIVLLSEDCGDTWVRIFAEGERDNGKLATVPRQTTAFTPVTSEDWCGGGWGSKCNILDLSKWGNKPNIKIAFESYNRNGNNLYIDNISISSTTAVKYPLKASKNTIQLFPNPTSGTVQLFAGHYIEDLMLSFYNAQGSLVKTHQIKSTTQLSESLNLAKLPKGVYIVKISGNKTNEQQRLIIN